MDVLGIREIWLGRSVKVTQKLSDLTDTVASVVEEENRIVI